MSSPNSSDSNNNSTELSEEALRWIVRLHSGTATAQDWQCYQMWRATSQEHEGAAVEAEALWADMSELHVDPASGLVRPGKKPTVVSRRTLLAGALCLGGAAVLGGTFGVPGTVRRLSADYATSTASPRTIELEDGSRVFLNANSAIDVAFDTASRRVDLLEGQAFFEVARDAGRPFEVMVDDVSVRALGTAFDVARNLPDVRAEVAVTEHAVRVSAVSSLSGFYGSPVEVSEGESVTIDRSGRIGGIRKQDASITTAWREGMYIAEARSLSEVVAALSTWHHGMIVISDDRLKSLKVNAVLDLRDPNGSLDALQGGLPVRVRHLSSYLTIISRR